MPVFSIEGIVLWVHQHQVVHLSMCSTARRYSRLPSRLVSERSCIHGRDHGDARSAARRSRAAVHVQWLYPTEAAQRPVRRRLARFLGLRPLRLPLVLPRTLRHVRNRRRAAQQLRHLRLHVVVRNPRQDLGLVVGRAVAADVDVEEVGARVRTGSVRGDAVRFVHAVGELHLIGDVAVRHQVLCGLHEVVRQRHRARSIVRPDVAECCWRVHHVGFPDLDHVVEALRSREQHGSTCSGGTSSASRGSSRRGHGSAADRLVAPGADGGAAHRALLHRARAIHLPRLLRLRPRQERTAAQLEPDEFDGFKRGGVEVFDFPQRRADLVGEVVQDLAVLLDAPREVEPRPRVIPGLVPGGDHADVIHVEPGGGGGTALSRLKRVGESARNRL
mmetsp:Transcript_1548/g.3651  ORF Transcript_1548/g.3651 Transcript_1548/m.3651 type:complete len:389 (+) Transcript_1548:275-1441(+)